MKITVNDVELFTLSETQKNVLKDDIPSELFEDDMKRRLYYVLTHKYEKCFRSLKNEWDPKLEALGVESIPTNKDAYAELVFSQPTYLDKAARDVAAGAE